MPHSNAAMKFYKDALAEVSHAIERIADHRPEPASDVEVHELNMAMTEALVIVASPGICRNYGLPIEAVKPIAKAMLQAGEAEAERLKKEMN